MEISVIVPCYNLENYIGRCLRSILKQSYEKTDYEIIVVADSCTDGTVKAAKEVLSGGKAGYKVIEAHCGRPGLARNIGLEAAIGNFIWFVDGDDYLIDDGAFVKLTAALAGSGAGAAYMDEFESDEPVIDDFAAWRYFYDRKLIGEDRFGEAALDEDWEFTRRLARKPGYKEARIAGKLYHYAYPREGSATAKYREAYIKLFGEPPGPPPRKSITEQENIICQNSH